MWWLLAGFAVVIALVGFVLSRRGSRSLSGNSDDGRPAECFRLPGAGGGNNGGFAG
jgi:hypothetical protein